MFVDAGHENPVLLEPMVKIPEHIKQNLLQGIHRGLEQITTNQYDLLLVLQCSGSLVFPALEHAAEIRDTPIPQVVHAPIGRDFFRKFVNERYEANPALFDTGDYILSDHLDEYTRWLDTDERANLVVQQLQAQADAKGIQPKKIAIVDDTRFTDGTLETARLISTKAWKNVETNPMLLFKNSNWGRHILTETLGSLNESTEFFFRELMKGYLPIDRPLRMEFVPITSTSQLEVLGSYTQKQKDVNPFLMLQEQYGIPYLLTFHKNMVNALEKAAEAA